MRVNSLLTSLPSLCALVNVSSSRISSVIALRYPSLRDTPSQKYRPRPQQNCQSAPFGSGILPHHHPYEPSKSCKKCHFELFVPCTKAHLFYLSIFSCRWSGNWLEDEDVGSKHLLVTASGPCQACMGKRANTQKDENMSPYESNGMESVTAQEGNTSNCRNGLCP